jgi:hypothetical protein
MPVRDRYPQGVPCWIDVLTPDPDALTRFYERLFGWEFDDITTSGSDGHYLVARLGGQAVAGIGTPVEGSSGPTPWSTSVAVHDADGAARSVREAGGRVVTGPTDLAGLGRAARCTDPSGGAFGVWQPGTLAGAEAVNAPGTWNWSNLETTDPTTAEAFYAAVFGWTARTVAFGPTTSTMLCRPGYGDFLATLDPDLRDRHAESGVPEGFSDAIGWMADTAAVGTEASAWTVTFAVDRPDEVADRAIASGGTVVVAPHDLGPSRLAVLQDPHGAAFTVSAYQPG